MDTETRIARATRGVVESLTADELAHLFETNEAPRAYIGFEPSGRLTVGHLVCIRKMRDLQEAGCDLTVFLADWHAWINDKLGGSLDRIAVAGRYMEAAFMAFGVDPVRTRYRWAHELVGQPDYWERVVRIAKVTSLARTRRAMTVLGRSESEEELDTAKLLYPAMQAADIFELPVEIAFAGIDQRRAHVLAREVAQSSGWPVPVALHTPLVSSLKGKGRMDATVSPAEGKMSKSDPTGAIPLPSSPEEIAERLRGAFCPAKEVEGNPVVELALSVIFPWSGSLEVERAEKFGGPVTYASPEEILSAWTSGALHPVDLKSAVARALGSIVAPASKALEGVPGADGTGL